MMAEAETPLLVKVTVCAALLVPAVWFAKFSGFGDATTLMPFTTPERTTTWFVLAVLRVLLVKVIVPENAPALGAVNVSATLHRAPGTIVIPMVQGLVAAG